MTTQMHRCGTATEHCCWFEGKPCQYVEPADIADFKWRCGLRAKHGSWEETHASPEYTANVKPKMTAIGYPNHDCGDWPPKGHGCNDCGEQIDG